MKASEWGDAPQRRTRRRRVEQGHALSTAARRLTVHLGKRKLVSSKSLNVLRSSKVKMDG